MSQVRSTNADVVAYEEAVNQNYRKKLLSKSPEQRAIPRQGAMIPGVDTDVECLIARVELDRKPPELDRAEFYLGPAYADLGDAEVFSWATPVAAVFYTGTASDHEYGPLVKVRRTLASENDSIVEVVDDWVVEQTGTAFGASDAGAVLKVPAPPKKAGSARPRAARAPTPPKRVSPPHPEKQGIPEVEEFLSRREPVKPEPARKRAPRRRPALTEVRAPSVVLAALRKPRQSRMSSVLATLQPDQYDLVSRPTDEPLIVQGHPGTGKTVIAAHRAAFLVHQDRGERLGRVLLLGPSEGFVNHVEQVVRRLDAERRVTVRGLEGWLKEIAGIRGDVFGPADGEELDTAWGSGSLFRQALRRTGGATDAQKLWDVVRRNQAGGSALTADPKIQGWLAGLPAYDEALKQRKYLPLIAYLAISVHQVSSREQFDHLLVDEAQDLRPLEWRVISEFNRGDSWTIVGDMHQRHSDRTYARWNDLVRDLGLSDDPDSFTPMIFERGYRSTEAILNFANRLLPKGQRAVACLQTGGEEPVVRRVGATELNAATVKLAEEFLERHPGTTTAVITTTPYSVYGTLRAGGWRKYRDVWSRDGQRIAVVKPEQARGLEYDAVVVEEPGAFPANYGRRGPLYTSLTRANRELGIVYTRDLPPALRPVTR